MRIATNGRLLLAIFLLVLVAATSRWTRDAEAQAKTPPGANACPGEQMTIQATGVYTQKPVEEIMINGKPAPGAIWSAGMRSYWHCHAGGQL